MITKCIIGFAEIEAEKTFLGPNCNPADMLHSITERKRNSIKKKITRDGRKGSKNSSIYKCANCLLDCLSLHSNSLLHCPSCDKAALP